MGLLGVPRQGGIGWLSLMADADEKPLLIRLGWMVLIWAASVAVIGAVAWFIRLWIAP